MAVTLVASVTNTGRVRHAQGTVTGKAFKVTHFSIGTEGDDPGDPLTALPPDPSITELPGQVFGPEPVDGSGYSTPTCPFWDIVLESDEANGTSVSSLALWATITDNGDDPVDEVGDTFLYAVAHFPGTPKVSGSQIEFQAGIQV